MIEFVTLFLTLVWGERPVEVTVDPAVAVVELRLNEQPAARLEGPPWRAEIDLGSAPMPQELTAVAFDKDGEEVGRVSQRVNFGPFTAEARLALERDEEGTAHRARLIWQTFDQRQPIRIEARFDGQPIEVQQSEGGAFIPIPEHDLDFPHLLEAELEFADEIRTRADLPFGGRYGERVTSDLTGVAILLPRGMKVPTPEVATGWLQVEGRPLPVFAVRKEPAVVFIVRDHTLRLPLPTPPGSRRLLRDTPLNVTTIEDDLYFLGTVPHFQEHEDGVTAIFPPTRLIREEKRRGLDDVLKGKAPPLPQDRKQPQRLVDAVVAAGQAAATMGRPRAVILLADAGTQDASLLPAAEAVEYLRVLRIPTFVWYRGKGPLKDAIDTLRGDRDYSPTSLPPLLGALQDHLRRQVVVWLEGRYLPQDIHLAPDAPKGLALVQ